MKGKRPHSPAAGGSSNKHVKQEHASSIAPAAASSAAAAAAGGAGGPSSQGVELSSARLIPSLSRDEIYGAASASWMSPAVPAASSSSSSSAARSLSSLPFLDLLAILFRPDHYGVSNHIPAALWPGATVITRIRRICHALTEEAEIKPPILSTHSSTDNRQRAIAFFIQVCSLPDLQSLMATDGSLLHRCPLVQSALLTRSPTLNNGQSWSDDRHPESRQTGGKLKQVN